MPKIVNAALKAKAWTFEAKAIKFGLEVPWGQGLALRTTSLVWIAPNQKKNSKIIPQYQVCPPQSQMHSTISAAGALSSFDLLMMPLPSYRQQRLLCFHCLVPISDPLSRCLVPTSKYCFYGCFNIMCHNVNKCYMVHPRKCWFLLLNIFSLSAYWCCQGKLRAIRMSVIWCGSGRLRFSSKG